MPAGFAFSASIVARSASVLASGKDEDWVMLTGALVRKERANEYVFRDSTGEIKATVLSDVFAGRVLHADQTVRAVAASRVRPLKRRRSTSNASTSEPHPRAGRFADSRSPKATSLRAIE